MLLVLRSQTHTDDFLKKLEAGPKSTCFDSEEVRENPTSTESFEEDVFNSPSSESEKEYGPVESTHDVPDEDSDDESVSNLS